MPPPWPEYLPFAASKRQTLTRGVPDFPATAGGREQGKFRESARPGLAAVAAVNDDGTPIGAPNEAEQEMILLLKAVVLGLSLITDVDLINEVS